MRGCRHGAKVELPATHGAKAEEKQQLWRAAVLHGRDTQAMAGRRSGDFTRAKGVAFLGQPLSWRTLKQGRCCKAPKHNKVAVAKVLNWLG